MPRSTPWQIDAPVGGVWEALSRPEGWPLVALRGRSAAAPEGRWGRSGSDASVRLAHAATLYETVAVERERQLVARARGDADGQGTWRFEHTDQGTRVEYEWRIHLANPWMRRLAPLAAPHSSGTTTA